MEEAIPIYPPPEAAISSDGFAGQFLELVNQLSPEIPIHEELVEEVMQELYKELMPTTTIASDSAKLSSTEASFPTPSVVVGGWKSDSCGASFSDSASTVMAGVKFAGTAGKMRGMSPGNGVGEWRSECGGGGNNNSNNGLVVVGKKEEGLMVGCDEGGEVDRDDDAWFERVLKSSWGPVDLDPWF